MPSLHLSPLATAPQSLTQRYGPVFVHTDFDYLTAWRIACLNDDLEGDREAAEDPNALEGEEESDPENMPDFDPPSDDDDGYDSSTSSSSADSYRSSTLSDNDAADDNRLSQFSPPITANNLGFKTVLTPTPHPPPSPAASTSDDEPEQNVPPAHKRRRSATAKKSNSTRKDRKKRQKKTQRREDGELPIHGDQYVQRYLNADVVERDFDVITYSAVKGGDTGKNERKTDEKSRVSSLEESRKESYALFPWDGK